MPTPWILVAVPVIEVIVAFLVAHVIGWWPTLGLLLLCSFIGVWQLKVQGLNAWRRCREDLRNGKVPTSSLLDGALRLFGSVLLVLPGFVTFICALPFLLAPSRRVFANHAGRWTVGRLQAPFTFASDVFGFSGAMRNRRQGEDDIVDVEGWEEPPTGNAGPRPMLPHPPERQK